MKHTMQAMTTAPPPKGSLWARLSLQKKMMLFLTVICSCVLLVFWFAFYQVQGTLRQTDARAEHYYSVNEFLDNFISADTQLDAYMLSEPRDSTLLYGSNEDMLLIEEFLSQLSDDPAVVGEEQYLLQNALKNSYEVYHQKRNSVLARLGTINERSAIEDYKIYVQAGGDYIESNARMLLRQVLRDDRSYFLEQKQQTRVLYFCGGILAMVLLASIVALFYGMLVAVMRPLMKLSAAANEISKENFDIPDVEVENRDEIYQLATAFNNMRRSMKAAFRALQEKNEIAARLHEAEMHAVQAQKRAEQAKMEQLQSQINPHFLFNTLNVISRTARQEKAPRSEKLILSLARLFRHSLKTDDGFVTVKHEMGIINDYITIQTSRFGDRVGLVWRIGRDIDIETQEMPTFLLQPVVENAIIHGLEPKIEGGLIRVHIRKQDGNLVMTVTDNGVGMDKTTLEHLMDSTRPVRGDVSGIGMSNIVKRLQLLGAPDSFQIRSHLGKGTSITMRIPCENKKDSL